MEELVGTRFETNLYLQTCKCKLSRIAVLYIAVFDVVLFLINNLTKDLGLLRISSSLVALCAVSYFVWIRISYKFSITTAKLIPPTMNLEEQKKYQRKQQIGMTLVVFVTFALSAIYFVVSTICYQYTMNTSDNELNVGAARLENNVYSADNSFLWKYLFVLFIIMLLCTGFLLNNFISLWGVYRLVSFRFSSNRVYSDCVSKNGMELMQNGVCIATLDLSKNKFFFENFGVLLVYTTDTEDFKVFANTEFDSIVLRKNDGSTLGELLFTNDRWQFI